MDFQAVALETEAHLTSIMNSESDWKSSKSTDMFTMEYKSSPDFEGNMYRSKASLAVPFEESFKYISIMAGSPRYEWDSDINKHQCLQEIDSNTQILWTVSNSMAMGLISPRDLVQLVHVTKTSDMIQLTAKSVDLDAHPPQEKIVRGTTYPWGIRVTKDPVDSNKSNVTILIQLEFNGKLPKSLVDSSLPSVQASMNKNYISYMKKIGVLK